MVRRTLISLFAVLALALPAASAAPPSWVKDSQNARKGLGQAASAGRLAPETAEQHRQVLDRALAALRKLPDSRNTNLAAVLSDVAAQWRSYNEPRALTLFSMLELNTDYLTAHATPRPGRDIQDAEGVTYRAFTGRGFQFHPLANFGRLNAYLAANRLDEAGLLAHALLARAVPRGEALTWEYHFAFGGGRAPWISGMAQAVGAQAIARASEKLGDPEFAPAARRAYVSIPGKLELPQASGPWIRLYSFNNLVVLNAQLQTTLSLADYAAITADVEAQDLANRMRAAAAGLLPRFDTGFWSLYGLGGMESTLEYHRFVVSLLKKLAVQTAEPIWSEKALRFEQYLKEPPLVEAPAAVPAIYPVPLDGFRDEAKIAVRLSKVSRVTLEVDGERRVTMLLSRGPHILVWKPGSTPPGSHPAGLEAVDLAGNRAETELQSLVIARDTDPPEVSARFRASRLSWRATDEATPWVRLQLLLEGDRQRRVLQLGRRPLRGSLKAKLPRGVWRSSLLTADSSGNRTRTALGLLASGG